MENDLSMNILNIYEHWWAATTGTESLGICITDWIFLSQTETEQQKPSTEYQWTALDESDQIISQ